MSEKCDGEITLVRNETREYSTYVDEDGNIVNLNEGPDWPSSVAGGSVLDIHETSLWCSKCRHIGSDEYLDHGISEDWQEV